MNNCRSESNNPYAAILPQVPATISRYATLYSPASPSHLPSPLCPSIAKNVVCHRSSPAGSCGIFYTLHPSHTIDPLPVESLSLRNFPLRASTTGSQARFSSEDSRRRDPLPRIDKVHDCGYYSMALTVAQVPRLHVRDGAASKRRMGGWEDGRMGGWEDGTGLPHLAPGSSGGMDRGRCG